jgi:hypothetical protein
VTVDLAPGDSGGGGGYSTGYCSTQYQGGDNSFAAVALNSIRDP